MSVDTGELGIVASANLDVVPKRMAEMRSISYPARDDARIPGYLTAPKGSSAEKMPLVVMPHGGPRNRDKWQYDFLVQMLANRGYGVLQMNFRGSTGFGARWFAEAHQDWGGLTYNDVIDGVRWAIDTGVADPDRIFIVGWSFGGYIALLGATRNSDLFRCAISIAGVSDLPDLLGDARRFVGGAVAREQVGSNRQELLANSPRNFAEAVTIPLLLIHGEDDYTVSVNQTKAMSKALRRAEKNHESLIIKSARHGFFKERDRLQVLRAVEAFLADECQSPQ